MVGEECRWIETLVIDHVPCGLSAAIGVTAVQRADWAHTFCASEQHRVSNTVLTGWWCDVARVIIVPFAHASAGTREQSSLAEHADVSTHTLFRARSTVLSIAIIAFPSPEQESGSTDEGDTSEDANHNTGDGSGS